MQTGKVFSSIFKLNNMVSTHIQKKDLSLLERSENPVLNKLSCFILKNGSQKRAIYFVCIFCPVTMTTQAESINSDLAAWTDWTDDYDTHNIEHRTEPVNH